MKQDQHLLVFFHTNSQRELTPQGSIIEPDRGAPYNINGA